MQFKLSRSNFITLCLLLILQHTEAFHGEVVDELQCIACNSSTYCTGGLAVPCPDNSRSDPSSTSSNVEDCICLLGYNRTYDQCYEGHPPYYWVWGVKQLCPANMQTVDALATNNTWCVCNPGYEPNVEGLGCVPCSIRHAKSEASNATCSLCDADTYADTTGLAVCKSCTENATSEVGASSCFCAAGYVSNVSSNAPADGSACVPCPVNSYREQEQNECQPCGGHMLSPPASGARFDCLCDAGYYFEGLYGHSDSCLACPVNTYKGISTTADNIEACNACPDNSASLEASTSIADCECPGGYERIENELNNHGRRKN